MQASLTSSTCRPRNAAVFFSVCTAVMIAYGTFVFRSVVCGVLLYLEPPSSCFQKYLVVCNAKQPSCTRSCLSPVSVTTTFVRARDAAPTCCQSGGVLLQEHQHAAATGRQQHWVQAPHAAPQRLASLRVPACVSKGPGRAHRSVGEGFVKLARIGRHQHTTCSSGSIVSG